MIKLFFALAPHFMAKPEYEAGTRDMAKRFNFDATFAHSAPAGADETEWLATALAESQFAFFDFTGLDSKVVFAYGVASQIDVYSYPLVDGDERSKFLDKNANAFQGTLLSKAQSFYGADDFQRKAHLLLDRTVGLKAMHDQRLVSQIKKAVESKHPIYMRQLAKNVGKPMHEIQPVVYDLVRKGEIGKIGETSGTQYTPLN